jgi:hypothetical protein
LKKVAVHCQALGMMGRFTLEIWVWENENVKTHAHIREKRNTPLIISKRIFRLQFLEDKRS